MRALWHRRAFGDPPPMSRWWLMTGTTIDPDILTSDLPEDGSPDPRTAELQTAPLAELEREICCWAGRIAAATCRMLGALATFDRRRGWSGLGMASCAQWLAWRCGLRVRTAQEHVAVAHALEALPAVRSAFAAGRLSYSKVRAIARVAEPETERTWLAHVLHCTAGQLERLASKYHQLTADPAGQRAARKVTWGTRSDGLFRLSAVLTAEEGARLAAAIDAARASLADTSPPPNESADAPPDGEIVNPPRDRAADADALVMLAEGFLCRPAPGLMTPSHTLTVHVDLDTLLADAVRESSRPTSHETATTAPGRSRLARQHGTNATSLHDVSSAGPGTETGEPMGRITDLRDRPRTQVAVDNAARPKNASDASIDGRQGSAGAPTDQATGGPRADPDPGVPWTDRVSRLAQGLLRCEAEPGVGLPRGILRRLGCDGLVRALIRGEDGTPMALGRRRRLPTQRLREACYARDGGRCQYPGCAHTRWLQVHHLREWLADEGETDLENLTLVCTRHHRLIHDEGIVLSRRRDGHVVATLPDGFVVIPAPRLDLDARPAERLAEATRHIAADAIHTANGGRLSWDDSLYVLMQHKRPPDGGWAA